MAKTNAGKRTPRREKKNIPVGIVHINASFNNTQITITDLEGNTVVWATSGGEGFKGTRKGTPFAAQVEEEVVAHGARPGRALERALAERSARRIAPADDDPAAPEAADHDPRGCGLVRRQRLGEHEPRRDRPAAHGQPPTRRIEPRALHELEARGQLAAGEVPAPGAVDVDQVRGGQGVGGRALDPAPVRRLRRPPSPASGRADGGQEGQHGRRHGGAQRRDGRRPDHCR